MEVVHSAVTSCMEVGVSSVLPDNPSYLFFTLNAGQVLYNVECNLSLISILEIQFKLEFQNVNNPGVAMLYRCSLVL